MLGLLGWSPETWTAIGTIALAAVTVGAVFALEPLRRRFGRARVTLKMASGPPDTHMIEMRPVDPELAPLTGASHRSIYVRARVNHENGATAEAVEITAARIWRIGNDERSEQIVSFLPLPLIWSHVGGATQRIPADAWRNCDIAEISLDERTREPRLRLQTIARPYPVGDDALSPTEFPPGRYELELVLSGDNVKPIRKRWRFSCPLQWADDEPAMLRLIDVQPVE